MEKVLRKIKCSDRLPKVNKFVNTDLGLLILRNLGQGRFGFDISGLSEVHRQPEYWYEEVELDSLFREWYPLCGSILNLLAKERYEKAIWEAMYWFNKRGKPFKKMERIEDLGEDLLHLLRTAAGIEENVV